MSLVLVHADPDFLVVDKPAGLLAIPGRTEPDSVITRARARHPDATGTLMVHRLDMDTSGLMLVALTREAQSALARQFEARTVEKSYVAVVGGVLAQDGGTIELRTRLDVERRPLQIVDAVHGKLGQTRWRVLARDAARSTTRVRFEPLTGRTHQLRLHALHGLGAPILGDRLYGDPGSAPRLLLHAERLVIRHPRTAEQLEFHICPQF